MKIIFLNTWGGKVFEPLAAFLRESAPSADFFCLQEVFDSPEARTVSWGGRANILADLSAGLGDFTPYYKEQLRGFDWDESVDFELTLGLAIFAKKNIPIMSHGRVFIYGEDRRDTPTPGVFPHILQYLRFSFAGQEYTIANLHGVAHPGSKLDTPERLAQSRRIIEFLNGETGEKILGGDFNLMPDTESIRMIERAGMRNLIREFGVKSTRSALNYDKYPESRRQYFSDYVFVSPEARVRSFTVPELNISDHLPLVLELE